MNKSCIDRKLLIGGLCALFALGACTAPETRGADSQDSRPLPATTAPGPSNSVPGARGEIATVVRVVDGDTIRVRVGTTQESVRLIGIDTPETVDPRKAVQCFGREASDRTKALLPVGTTVRLVADVEGRDRYKRMLRYVYRDADGLFVNEALVRDGYARVYTYPPNVAHANDFVAAERDARANQRGLWSAC